MFPSIQAEVAAGNPPDIAQLVLREWDLNVENLPVKALTDLIAPDELQQHIAGTYPIHPKAVKLTAATARCRACPTFQHADPLLQRGPLQRPAWIRTIRRRRGRKSRRPGTDQRAHRATPGVYIACIENDWCAQAVLPSNGARIMCEDRTTIMFGEPPAIEVFRFWQKHGPGGRTRQAV